jgi:hypothetical protein
VIKVIVGNWRCDGRPVIDQFKHIVLPSCRSADRREFRAPNARRQHLTSARERLSALALDLWFEKAYRKRCKGKAKLIRYADDCAPRRRGKEAARPPGRALLHQG